ncbi:MAG: nucleotidyltransferase domain-containing protein [Atribacterota bacterium]|nr:nucleotidyltransferase domain-containing protein [Atribacterota bacterium]
MACREERRRRLEEELRRIVGILRDWGVEKVILFGSLASGVVHSRSDLDLIVVADVYGSFLERLEEIYRLIQPRVAVDILVYTREEFQKMGGSSFVKKALQEGKVVYERTAFQ